MSKRAYCRALELRIRRLADQLVALKLWSEHAGFVGKFRCSQDIRRLEQRKQELDARLSELTHQKDGLWEDIKANIRGVVGEFPSGIERWMERLDKSYAEASASPEAGDHSHAARDQQRTRRLL
jgi:hypothetical protein